jgi:hypothetical protein
MKGEFQGGSLPYRAQSARQWLQQAKKTSVGRTVTAAVSSIENSSGISRKRGREEHIWLTWTKRSTHSFQRHSAVPAHTLSLHFLRATAKESTIRGEGGSHSPVLWAADNDNRNNCLVLSNIRWRRGQITSPPIHLVFLLLSRPTRI